jgi:hypothetical protein
MQVFSAHSGSTWIETKQAQATALAAYDVLGGGAPDDGRDLAKEEIKRVLSDCFRCNNLVILTGLGTSLHVNAQLNSQGKRTSQNGKRIAPTMMDLWNKAVERSGEVFSTVLALSKFPNDDAKFTNNIEALLSYCKIGAEFTDTQENKDLIQGFISDTEEIIRSEVDFLDDDDDVGVHAELLRKIARRSSRKVRTKIFTTNYDLCFELAARQGRYVVIDGFSHTNPQVFDSIYFSYDIVKREANPDSHDFITNVFHLYKLHGSVDWEKNSKTNEIQRAPGTTNPILVYPRNTKYELAFEQPYIEMMSAFQAALRQPETALLIAGFGFNDNHLAEPIMSAIRSNLSLKVVVCDPALAPNQGRDWAGSVTKNDHLKKLAYLISNGDARLSLINATFQELVPELPDIAALTDLEQHLDRMRLLRGQENER